MLYDSTYPLLLLWPTSSCGHLRSLRAWSLRARCQHLTYRTSVDGIQELTDRFKQSLKTCSPEDADNACKFLQSYIQACGDEHILEKSGQATRLITTALTALKQRGISVDVSIHNGISWSSIGWRQTYREHGYNMEAKTQEHIKATMRIMFHAIFRSGCKVSSFQIVQYRYRNHDLDDLEDSIDLADSAHPMLQPFVGLRSLDLVFKKMPNQKTLDTLDSVLGHLYCLERLKLELDCDPDSSSPSSRVGTEDVLASDTLLGSLSSTCLRQIELENVCISQERLVKLLKASEDCIERLKLHYVCLRRGSWYTVLSWIRDHLILNRLELFALFEIDESDPDEEGYYASAWKAEKVDDMLRFLGEHSFRSGLSKLLTEDNESLADQ